MQSVRQTARQSSGRGLFDTYFHFADSFFCFFSFLDQENFIKIDIFRSATKDKRAKGAEFISQVKTCNVDT